METDIDYPESLPAFLIGGYGLNYSDNILRSDGNGLSEQRQFQENIPVSTSVSILTNSQQARLFEAWYKHDVKSIKWFNANIKTEIGYDKIACRFIGRYQGPVLVGANLWQYTFTLELYKNQVFGKDWYEYGFDFIQHASIFDIAMNREWPES